MKRKGRRRKLRLVYLAVMLAAFVVLAIVTRPSEARHQRIILTETGIIGALVLGGGEPRYDDYLVCSTMSLVQKDGTRKRITFGVFGFVMFVD